MKPIRTKLILPFFSIFLLSLSVWVLSKELDQYKPRDILNSLAAIPESKIYLGIVFTILGYIVITFYDFIAFVYVRHQLASRKIVLSAIISHAFSNVLGFALLTGGAIRYRFYSQWRVPPKAMAGAIALGTVSFWLGFLSVAAIAFMVEPLSIPQILHLPFLSVRPLGVFFFLLVAIYLFFCWRQKPLTIRGEKLFFPSMRLSVAQIITSGLDWGLAAAVLYCLLPAQNALSYPGFFSIYLLAITASILSHVPGGLGVFETVIILLLPSLSESDILGSLIAYRGIYFLLPLFVAILLLGIYEINQRLKLK